MTECTRRDALAGAVALGAVGIAGCVTGSGDTPNPDPENGSAPDDNGNDSTTPEDSGNGGSDPADSGAVDNSVVNSSIETTAATCGNLDGGSETVSVTNTTVTIDGTRGGLSNPCHEAVLGAVRFENGELTVEVGTRSTAGPDEACITCVGTVEYEVTVELESAISAGDVRVTAPQPESR